jgi:hypothetical protein
MPRLMPTAMLTCSLLLSVMLSAQSKIPSTCPYVGHVNDLACLIPGITSTGASGGNGLSSFNTTVAQVLGQLPLAVPVSGFVLGFDAKLGIPIDITQNLGSVLTERGNTVGKYKLFVGFTYQRFVFETVDGVSLNNLPLVGLVGSGKTEILTGSRDNLSANIDQYTAIAAFGLSSRIDVSATVPFERVSLAGGHGVLSEALASQPGSVGTVAALNVSGSASGVGDLILNLKGTVIPGEKSKMAMGLEARFPTGDVYNLLGSGAYGIKPYVVFSRFSGRFTPHANLGYQWNGFSLLRVNPCYYQGGCSALGSGIPTLRLPDSLDYSGGVDVGLVPKKLSAVADIVGQRFFTAPRVTAPGPSVLPGVTLPPGSPFATSVNVTNASYFLDNAAVGLKWDPVSHLIISANALIRLDSGGLRPARFVPLGGISYRF